MLSIPPYRGTLSVGAALISAWGCSLLAPSDRGLSDEFGKDASSRPDAGPRFTDRGGAPTGSGGGESGRNGASAGGARAGAGGRESMGGAGNGASPPAAGGGSADSDGGRDAGGGVPAMGGQSIMSGGRDGGTVADGAAGCDGATCGCDGSGCGSPYDVPRDGLLLWLRGDRGITQSNGAVEKWADQSGNLADALQPVTLFRPKLVETASGLPMLDFDGDDDQLGLPSGFSNFGAGISIFVVAQAADDASCGSLVHLSSGSEDNDIDVERNQMTLQYEVENATLTGTHGAFEAGRPVVLSAIQSVSTSADIRVCDLSVGNARFALPAVALRSQNFIGKNLYSECVQFHGRIGEILVYARPLSPLDATALEKSLSARWKACG